MIIGIGSDHGGTNLKEVIKKHLSEKGYEVKDYGTQEGIPADYPDVAEKVCAALLGGECEKAVLICGTGIGISISANKIDGIRAAHVTDCFSARMAMEHNNAQIICLGERITGPGLACDIVDAYLGAKHQGGRHAMRVEKIMALEKK